jgi:intein/homing endonuclease
MAENKLTVWQRLGKVFGPTSTLDQQSPVFKFDKKQLLKTTDKTEFEREKLEAQQTMYIGKQWQKVENNLYQQAVYYEPTRMASYYDFESMEYSPEISAALDIYAEESTTPDQDGHILKVYSESKRIKQVLVDLFVNRLDINTNLPMWTRNACKFGDNFTYLKLDPEKGVVGCQQLPNIQIERLEKGMRFQPDKYSQEMENDALKFVWKEKNMEFNTWEIAHFRILGDDRKLPYGTSMLEKSRRIWKQLCVSENTDVWTTEGYKKIKNIKPGELIYSFDFDNNQVIETKVKDCWQSGIKKTFNIRTRYNSIDVTDDHQVLIYNDGNFTYKTLNEFNLGKDRLVTPTIDNGKDVKIITLNSDDYYIKLNNKGLDTSSKINRDGIVKKLKEINEKDYKNIHRFLQGNGKIKYEYINQLVEIFSFEKDDFDLYYNDTKSLLNIDLQYEINSDFVKFFGFMLGDGWLTNNGVGFALGVDDDLNNYYIDYVKNNIKEKLSHNQSKTSEYSRSVVIQNKELKNIFLTLGFITGFAKKRIPEWVYSMKLNVKRALIRGLFDADGSDKYGVIGLSNENLIKDLKELCLQSGIACGRIGKKDGNVKFNEKTGKYETRQDTYKLYINFNSINDNVRYEKIIDITENEEEPVWDLEVESELHNFIANGSVVHNCLSEDAMLIYRVSRAPERRVFKVFVGNMDDKDVDPYVQRVANKFKRDQIADPKTGNVDMRYNQLAVDQDYFIPVRDPSQTNPIETLPGGTNLAEIADIEYIQKKLVTALRIPKAYLGFEEAVGNGQNLSLLDIRFARTINKIQKSMLAELNKIAIIHLFLLGFEDELTNFTLGLHNPSKQSELLSLELWKEKIELYKNAVAEIANTVAPTSASWAKKNILGFSDEEIRLDLQQQRIERAVAAELAKTAEVITKTGLFDNIDQLYGKKPGEPAGAAPEGGEEPEGMPPMGGGSELGGPPPPPGPEPGGEAGVTPESTKKNDLNLILEDSLYYGKTSLDLSKGRLTINEIDDKLKDLLNK